MCARKLHISNSYSYKIPLNPHRILTSALQTAEFCKNSFFGESLDVHFGSGAVYSKDVMGRDETRAEIRKGANVYARENKYFQRRSSQVG